MRVRIRFAKFGRLRFLGHLDVLRYMQKAFRRSGLKISYSAGYHPHPLISFAQPLSLSLTSDGEYFDVEFDERYEEKYLFEQLSAAMCEDIVIHRVTILPDYIPHQKKVTGMSLVAGAMYAFVRREETAEECDGAWESLAQSNTLMLEKKTKKGTRECDVRAGVHGIWRLDAEGRHELLNDELFPMNDETIAAGIAHMDNYSASTMNPCFVAALDAGSENNISSELLIEALCKVAGVPYRPLMYYIHRMDIFGADQEGRMIPLWKME